MKKLAALLVVVLLISAILIAGCSAASTTTAPKPSPTTTTQPTPTAELPKALVNFSVPVGTATYIVVAGLSTVIEKHTGMKNIMQPLASLPVIVDSLYQKKGDTVNLVLAEAYAVQHSIAPYEKIGPQRIRHLLSGDSSTYFWITRPDTNIKTVQDFVGKKLSYISGVSPAGTLLYEYNLKYNNIFDKVTSLPRDSMASAARALIEKRVDVIGGPHGDFALDIAQATGATFIPLPPDYVKWLLENHAELGPSYETMKKGWFGLDKDYTTLTRARAMYARPDMPDDVAYAIVKAICENPKETAAIHESVGAYNLERAIAFGFLTPVHPGAIKYYKEKGIWTKEHDAMQQKWLAEEDKLMAAAGKK